MYRKILVINMHYRYIILMCNKYYQVNVEKNYQSLISCYVLEGQTKFYIIYKKR